MITYTWPRDDRDLGRLISVEGVPSEIVIILPAAVAIAALSIVAYIVKKRRDQN